MHNFVYLLREHELPDQTLTLRYGFVHVLYQNTLYASLQPARRAELSGAIAQSLLTHFGGKSEDIAAELAILFEGARDPARAVDQALIAARNAARLFANHEAVLLAGKGLKLLERLPDSSERARKELALLVTLGPPLKDTAGWAAPEVERVYSRARELCRQIGETGDLFPAVWGLWIFATALSNGSAMSMLGAELLDLAHQAQDSGMTLQAHHALATTHAVLGDWSVSRAHAERGVSLYDADEHREHKFLYGGHDPAVCCFGFASQSLWMLGYPDKALQKAKEGYSLALALGHPATAALIGFILGSVHHFRREPKETREQAEGYRQIVNEHSLPFYPSIQVGWALVEEGRADEGLTLMRECLAECTHIPRFWRAYLRSTRGGDSLVPVAQPRNCTAALTHGVPSVVTLAGGGKRSAGRRAPTRGQAAG